MLFIISPDKVDKIDYYVKSITINWNKNTPPMCGGSINLFGYTDEFCPFNGDIELVNGDIKLEDLEDSKYAEKAVLSSENTFSTYYFTNPVHYLAFMGNGGTSEIARFSSFSIHFVKNWENTSESQNVDFDWVKSEEESSDGTDKGFVYGKNNIVQAKVNGNGTHEANGLVVYDVKYREPNYKAREEENKTPPLSVLSDEDEENSNGRDEDGYRAANNGTEYSLNEADNSLNRSLTLLSAGDYKISISLPEESGFTTETEPLEVTVAQAETELNIQDLEEPFNSASPTYTWNQAINFKDSSVAITDFTVTIEPDDETTGPWVRLSDYQTSDVNEAYEAVMDGDIYRQYQQLIGQNDENSTTTVYIDGFFTELASPDIEKDSDPNYFNLSQNFPCSGVYNMTVNPEPSGNYIFDPQTVTITITPNLSTMFGAIPGFNINGYGFTVNDTSQIINYPQAEVSTELLKNSVAYKPGTYFDSEFSLTIDGSSNPGSKEQTQGKAPNTNWINFDLSALVNKSSVPVKATISKNGAVETLEFTVEKANVTTRIEEIETLEDGEAIYFNMQGLPVLNPSHGLFIKVTNGKASKILL